MSDAERPDPDALLARMKREEAACVARQAEDFLRHVAGRGEDLRHAASGAAEASRGMRGCGRDR